MIKTTISTRLLLVLLVSALVLAVPAPAFAQTIDPPPELTKDGDLSDEDILVFEPQLFWEFPFAQGFKISINFGVMIEVPHRLNLITDEVFNFFLRFRSYVIPAEAERTPAALTPSPTPESGD